MAVAVSLIDQCLDAAIRAPSSHNTQPWRFKPGDSHIDVLADRTRALPVNDPFDRELTISCGCAIGSIHAQAVAADRDVRVEILPVDNRPDLLARVHLAGHATRSEEGVGPAACIETRHTHRGAVAHDMPGPELRARLVRAAHAHGVRWQDWPHPAQRQAAADLVEAGDRAQWDDAAWRRELAQWMHAPRRGDGLTLPTPVAAVARAVVRATDLGGALGPRDAASVLDAPLLAVLTTGDDTPASWLATGRALQACLLIAAADGFQAAYFNQPMQVTALRPALMAHCDGRWPQVLLRLGRPLGDAGSHTPRRPLADVLVD